MIGESRNGNKEVRRLFSERRVLLEGSAEVFGRYVLVLKSLEARRQQGTKRRRAVLSKMRLLKQTKTVDRVPLTAGELQYPIRRTMLAVLHSSPILAESG